MPTLPFVRHTAPVAVLLLTLYAGLSRAEPYLSVRTGNECNVCHVNPTGGGMRTAFGSAYGASVLSVRPLTEKAVEPDFAVFDGLRLGGNARYSARQFDVDNVDSNLEFTTDAVTLYGRLQLNQYLALYVDQQVAPGGSINRESWVKIQRKDWYLKGGKIFLPFGWRLQDDTAFVRQASGVTFSTPDNGVELGYDTHHIQAQLSVTNGSGGGGEVDDGKWVMFRGNWLDGWGQLGVSAGYNDTDLVDRKLIGIFAGLNTGPVTWLLEYDQIEDDDRLASDTEMDIALLEANWLVVKGQNLKLSLEHQSFSGEDRDRKRASFVWEYFPWSHTQLRAVVRLRDSDDPLYPDGEEYFLQAHVYF